jgi:2-octaprenyl-6-methoxyphenol hydroxylase
MTANALSFRYSSIARRPRYSRRDTPAMPSTSLVRRDHTITVVGAGPAGLAAALSLARGGADVAIAASLTKSERDPRTTAVLGGGLEFLKNLGVWDRCAPGSAPLRAIRIIDDRGGLMRAPEVVFRSEIVGLDQFGANIPNTVLVEALIAAARSEPTMTLYDTEAVTAIEPNESGVLITDAEGHVWTSQLCVGADGRGSRARTAASIATRAWSYPQTAIVTQFCHARTHDDISTEFHRAAGPLTTVPLPTPSAGGYASSLVWVETPAESQRLLALDEDAFTVALAERLQGLLGRISSLSARAAFPLSGLSAAVMAQNRVALVGEAAHVLPPIGAQGLNLGLRDAAALADCVADGQAAGHAPGSPAVLAHYHAARSKDVASRTFAVDALNRSLLLDLLPVQMARSLGLHLTANSTTIQRMAMRQGLEPIGDLPRLMRRLGPSAHRAGTP